MARPSSESMDTSIIHAIHRASQCATEAFHAELGSLDVTPRQLAVLRAIETSSDPSQTTLVNATGIDRSTLADIMQRMLKKGLVARKRTKEDARAYAVSLTASGRSLLRKATPAADKVDGRLLDALPASRRTAFMRDLERLVAALAPAQV
jgi:MarR family transcriptional regulator, temperature-dependent positive regulator of motility